MSCRSILLFSLLAVSYAYIGKKDWRKVDLDAAGKQLEEGDDPELLIDEDKLSMEEYDRRRKGGMKKPEDDVALKDPSEWLRHSQAMSGPAMMFASVKNDQPDGTPYFKRDLERLSSRWQSMLKTAGLDAKVYDISDPDVGEKKPKKKRVCPEGEECPETPTPSPHPPRVLLSLNTGWRGYELRDFMLRQPELVSLEWDSVKFTPSDLDEDGNFKGGVRSDTGGMPIPAGLGGGEDMSPKQKAILAQGGSLDSAVKAAEPPKKAAAVEEDEDDEDE